MIPSLLLDTNVVIRWLQEPQKLSREQSRLLEQSVQQFRPVAVSAMSLLELAVLRDRKSHRIDQDVRHVFHQLRTNPIFEILPITIDIAEEIAALPTLRDPADMAIVATARVHRLRLLTSDQRIIDSRLANVVE